MSMHRFLVPADISTLGDDVVAVIMSTSQLARDGHVLLPMGCQLQDYRRNPIVLWQHDPNEPIGNAENITLTPAQISAQIRFAPLGISRKADEIRGLMKSGVVRAVSVAFDTIEAEPLNRNRPKGGLRISKWTLLELSACSVGADVNALVTARAGRGNGFPSDAGTDYARRQRQLEVLELAGREHSHLLANSDYQRRQRQLQALRLASE